jgi:S-disulfanyl-L-cysteine oxidoreductase SoxD
MGGPGTAVKIRALLIMWTLALATAAAADSTVRDKVYSLDQAKGGKTTYDDRCASCHDGGTMGPELWGDSFLTSWDGKTVATFYERIKTTMPEDSPGTLTETEILNLIAYVLQTNGFAAGDAAMQNGSALATMKFVRNK